jgi:uncharacterized protein YidB (DUF937 family)
VIFFLLYLRIIIIYINTNKSTIGSWVSAGKNLPVTGDQLQNVLGKDTIGNLASKLGMDSGTLTSKLTNLLPNVVDKLTPEGKVPEGDILSHGMDMFGGLFGKK